MNFSRKKVSDYTYDDYIEAHNRMVYEREMRTADRMANIFVWAVVLYAVLKAVFDIRFWFGKRR